MQTRRQFLAAGAAGASLVSLAGGVPLFLPRTLAAANRPNDNERILVVVELAGGNDGINTLVPYRDAGYARYRRALRLPADRLISIGNDLGLHPSMRALADCWEAGQLAVVQGVGYPNPSRSHFRSAEIWHSGSDADADHFGLGWVGKGLDTISTATTGPLCMSVGQQMTPLALRGRRTVSSSVQRLDQYMIGSEHRAELTRINRNAPPPTSDNLLQFVHRVHATALQTTAQLSAVAPRDNHRARYPDSEFGRQLRLTARLIRAEMKTRVYYTQQTGYDTHADQLPQHAALLNDLSESLACFARDLESAGLSDRVLVMAFSEFGRRVRENGAEGTDHGTAGPVLLLGSQVAAGLHGRMPSLTDLADGDLQMSVDFRQIYATLLEQWLQVPATAALGREFEPLAILAS